MSDRAAHRCRIRAIRDVEFCGDELMGQDQAGVSVLSRADWSIKDDQELGLGISLAAQCQAIHGPRIRIALPITPWLRTNGRAGLNFECANVDATVYYARKTGSAL